MMRALTPLLAALLIGLVSVSSTARADESPGIHRQASDLPLEQAYRRVYEALETARFWVVFEADMGQRMAKMRDRWGDEYNRHALTGVRSMVFCNIDWTHRVADANPDLLALCPLHLSVYGTASGSVVVMPRPSAIAADQPGAATAAALESELTGIIEAALEMPPSDN